jgi:hypothetical protein
VRSSRRHAALPLLTLVPTVVLALAASGASAASPSAEPGGSAAPTPAASILPGEVSPPGNIQAWSDGGYITPDAPPGGMVEAGFSFWDAREQDFIQIGDVYVRLHPAKGDAEPSDGILTYDFPGHVLAGLVVPEGGPGEVEVGMLMPACISTVGCGNQRAPFIIAGDGPPPDARLDQLIGAEILPLVGDTVVDREFPVSVNVVPKGLWGFDQLALPDHLVVIARHPGGQPLSTGDLRPGPQPGTPYVGRLSIPETGDVQIVVAIPREDGSNAEIEGASVDRQVIQGGRPSASSGPAPSATAGPASPVPASSSGGIPPLVWIVGIGAALVVGVIILRRVLADL